ncbi:MAG: DUF86 domain-containing protein [Promethearchaeota archaeon]
MPKRGNFEALSDILEAIKRIEKYIIKLDYENFLKDSKTQDAVVRNFEIIGEAVKSLDAKFRERYPKVPWKKIAGIKDKLIHHYFGVNFEIIWTIIEEELADLKVYVEEILQNEFKNYED